METVAEGGEFKFWFLEFSGIFSPEYFQSTFDWIRRWEAHDTKADCSIYKDQKSNTFWKDSDLKIKDKQKNDESDSKIHINSAFFFL